MRWSKPRALPLGYCTSRGWRCEQDAHTLEKSFLCKVLQSAGFNCPDVFAFFPLSLGGEHVYLGRVHAYLGPVHVYLGCVHVYLGRVHVYLGGVHV